MWPPGIVVCPQTGAAEHPKFMVLLKNLDVTHLCRSGEALGHRGAVGRTRRSHGSKGSPPIHRELQWVKWKEKLIPRGIKQVDFWTCIKLCFAEWCHPQNSRDPAGRGTRSKKNPGRSQKFTSFFPNILPSHPGLAKEHLMLLFPQLFHQKPWLRLSGTFLFSLSLVLL